MGDAPPPIRHPSKPIPIVVAGREFPSLRAAARHHGVPPAVAYLRLQSGWSPEKAFCNPVVERSVEVNGKMYASRAEAARAHGLGRRTAVNRMRAYGVSFEEALVLKRTRRKLPAPPGETVSRPQYLVCGPEGVSWRVTDLRVFAKAFGIEHRLLRLLAASPVPSTELHGWQCRKAAEADLTVPEWRGPSYTEEDIALNKRGQDE